VITGFNTDIEHEGVIYHVQTEDKGVETPLILSLVYNRGTILASKRSPYADLLQSGFDEKVLAERLQKQHKLMCAAIRAGRIEDLKQMTAREAALKKEAKLGNGRAPSADQAPKTSQSVGQTPPLAPLAKPLNSSAPVKQEQKTPLREINKESRAPAIPQPTEPLGPAIPQPKDELVWDLPLEIIDDGLIVDVGSFIEAETILAADAVEVISDLNTAPKVKKPNLEIEFLNETIFKAGERKTLNIRVFRGSSQNFIREAQVMVKVLGSSFRPLIFHARTNEQGVATVHLQLPQFRSGRGAILVRAISDGEEAELRQIVRQG
jgi:hypothetical protein